MDPLRPPGETDFENPYAPPQTSFAPEPPRRAAFAGVPFSAGEIVAYSWNVFKERPWPCMLIFWSGFVIQLAIAFGVDALRPILEDLADDAKVASALDAAVLCAGWLIQFWISIGMSRGMLAIGRRQPVAPGVLFSGGRYLVHVVGGVILVGMITCACLMVAMFSVSVLFHATPNPFVAGIIFVFGCSFCAVLCLYLVARLFQFFYLVIDRGTGALESVRLSWAMTRDRAGTIVVIYLFAVVLGLAGLLALCVGLLATIPLNSLVQAVTYLALIGPDERIDDGV